MTHPGRGGLRPAMVIALVALVACGGSERSRSASGSAVCNPGVDSAITTAALVYAKQVNPSAQRFLVPVGTDSTLPQLTVIALSHDRGPTYFYPSKAEQWPALREKLLTVGPWNALLMSLGDIRMDTTAGSIMVELHGNYVLGPDVGKAAAPQRYDVKCDSTGWHATQAAPATSGGTKS